MQPQLRNSKFNDLKEKNYSQFAFPELVLGWEFMALRIFCMFYELCI